MAKNSVKSTALEERVSLSRDGLGPWISQLLTRYSLVFLSLILLVVFSLCTDNFASMLTMQAILASKSKIALLALAATVTMIVGKMDLNVGFGVVLWHILVITFQEWYGLPWIPACLLLLCIAATASSTVFWLRWPTSTVSSPRWVRERWSTPSLSGIRAGGRLSRTFPTPFWSCTTRIFSVFPLPPSTSSPSP